LDRRSRYRGCLIGGAVGDALGAPVEFLSYEEIVAEFGPAGITDYAPAYGRIGAITDDTQMTLFTAEGLLRAKARWLGKGIVHIPAIVDAAYLRWLVTQGGSPSVDSSIETSWLFAEEQMHRIRAPGNTCLAALSAKTKLGRPAQNDSKGCGTAMRIAPLGLFLPNPPGDDLFEIGCELAALTHGHSLGIVPAGWLAVLLAGLVQELEFGPAIETAHEKARVSETGSQFVRQIERARDLAQTATHVAQAIEKIGGGWTADEAVAIAVFAVEHAKSFDEAITTAVNHSGDSDSTAAIAGNIYGAMVGIEQIGQKWIARLELSEVIRRVADDLFDFGPFGEQRSDFNALWNRYPGF
jgi:ADP-ribosylglycohydrolase